MFIFGENSVSTPSIQHEEGGRTERSEKRSNESQNGSFIKVLVILVVDRNIGSENVRSALDKCFDFGGER